ncbi:hypothetical protein CHARACLAT_019052 [Characodon lateralis]|uniref:Uncharacterized protein n=1 Tax=Characodon lateralis TaxID=208331 RepID=A0ABU7F4M7_9TELE|nr:hypothetical protein [Characodon lateralis]
MLLFCTLLNVHQRNSLGEETFSVASGFSELCSLAPPEGKTLNSLCAGCVGSAEILAALFLTLDLYKSWMEERSALILSAVLIIRCSLDLSCFVDDQVHISVLKLSFCWANAIF